MVHQWRWKLWSREGLLQLIRFKLNCENSAFFTCNVNIHFEFIWCLSFLFADSVDKEIDILSCQVKPNNATSTSIVMIWDGSLLICFMDGSCKSYIVRFARNLCLKSTQRNEKFWKTTKKCSNFKSLQAKRFWNNCLLFIHEWWNSKNVGRRINATYSYY